MRYYIVHIFYEHQNYPATFLVPNVDNPISAIMKAFDQLAPNVKVETVVCKPRKD